jgi:PGF-pre-PGF domain-containing protein
MSATINVLKSVPLVANFSTNVSKGHVPLSIQFTDLSENAKFWYWDFGDGTFDSTVSTQQNPVHTYLAAGNYSVTLAASDYNSTDYKSATIIISGQSELLVFPVADFSSSLVSGYAPLDVQFTDASQNATGQSWDFGDGSTSTEQNPAHTYFAAGTYLVRLVASNVNVTDSKIATINILENNSSNSGSSSGAGGSPEPAKNVEVKELSQTFVSSRKSVKFDFPRNATSVVYVSFDSKKTTGKTTTIVEMLKGKSTLVSELPSGEVYKSLNIWVGNGGFATGNNIENPVVCFKVEKAWAHDKKIDKSSIILNRYNYKKWNQLPTSLSGEDDKYLYFTAKTPGFSIFAIAGETKAIGTETQPSTENKTQSAVDYTQNKSTTESTATTVEQIPEQKKSLNNSKKESTKTPGFEIASDIVCLLGLFLYKRR